MAFYDAGDAAIFYEITGEGRPLTLLHGYALNSLMWDFQLLRLSDRYKVINIDLRGFGKSSCGGDWSGDVMAADVFGIIKYLDLKDCAILGFSMSGPVAFRLALEHPDRISRLVMASSILPSTGSPKKETQSLAQDRELETLTLYGVEEWADLVGMRSGPLVDNMFRRNPKIKLLWEKIIKRHNPDYLRCMMEARARTSSSINWRARLPEVNQPTLIIAGAQDVDLFDASHYLSRHIPGSKLEIIKGAGHMVNLEKPEEFTGTLIRFLK